AAPGPPTVADHLVALARVARRHSALPRGQRRLRATFPARRAGRRRGAPGRWTVRPGGGRGPAWADRRGEGTPARLAGRPGALLLGRGNEFPRRAGPLAVRRPADRAPVPER